MTILESAIAALGAAKSIPGETVFKLYDTYGFPLDLTADIARERGLSIDEAGFDAAMNAQRERGRAASRFGVDLTESVKLDARTEFTGYERLDGESRVVALLDAAGAQVQSLAQGAHGRVVLDHTPFYAESGGQVGDTGTLSGAAGDFEVEGTQKLREAHAHVGLVTRGRIAVGETLKAVVDSAKRAATARNHSATHLLHAALRKVLGTHVQQKGSLVEPERLRFDFSHVAPVGPEELARIEALVNDEVLANHEAATRQMAYDAAVASGAVALFGEKYGDTVRVLSLGGFSTELCGGTHVRRTGDIGLFKILSEGGVAAGVRRIEAVTGTGALSFVREGEHYLAEIGRLVRGGRDESVAKVTALFERSRRLEKEIEQLKAKLASGKGTDLAASAVEVKGVTLVATRIDGLDAKALRAAVDQLKDKLGRAIIVLGSAGADGKVTLVAGVTADLVKLVPAGELVAAAAARVGGKGGGRPDFAQAGGSDASQLDAALSLIAPLVESKLP
jgi:alanyl-tRNA synthetase